MIKEEEKEFETSKPLALERPLIFGKTDNETGKGQFGTEFVDDKDNVESAVRKGRLVQDPLGSVSDPVMEEVQFDDIIVLIDGGGLKDLRVWGAHLWGIVPRLGTHGTLVDQGY